MNKDTFKPLKTNILVDRIIESKESSSGIILQMKENTNTAFGTVTHISDEVTMINVGDTIMFNVLINNYVPVDGKQLLMMSEDDIYGKLSEGTKLDGINNFEITHDNDVLVSIKTQDENLTSTSGIILTAQASALHDRPTNGVVVKVGVGVTTINIGDRVEFEKTAGIDLTRGENNTHFTLMDVERIIGKYL